MPKAPRAPGAALLAWLTITGHAIAIAASLGASLSVILILTSADILGVVAISAVYFGRAHEWRRIDRHFAKRERLRTVPEGTQVPLRRTQRQAA